MIYLDMPFYVYLLKCADETYYCGYTNNLDKRVMKHNSKKGGAKYTKSRKPVELIYFEEYLTKAAAMKREYRIKQLSREEKHMLVTKNIKITIIKS